MAADQTRQLSLRYCVKIWQSDISKQIFARRLNSSSLVSGEDQTIQIGVLLEFSWDFGLLWSTNSFKKLKHMDLVLDSVQRVVEKNLLR